MEEKKDIVVSVLIVNWNSRDLLSACLKSIYSSQIDFAYEIIVVDNGSNDSSSAMVRDNFPLVRLIANQSNYGFTKACNQAYKVSGGEYIFLLNPDTELTSTATESIVTYLEGHPHTGAVAAGLYYPDGRFQNYYRRFPDILSELQTWIVGMRKSVKLRAFKKRYMTEDEFVDEAQIQQPPGAALMVRRSVVREAFFDEYYCIYFSDVDLCRTIYQKGFDIRLLKNSRIIHHHSEGGCRSKDDEFSARLSADYFNGLFYYFRKFEGSSRSMLLKVLILCTLFLKTAFEWMKKLFSVTNRYNYQKIRIQRILRKQMVRDE